MVDYMKNWIALDNLIEEVGHNTFIDEVLASLPKEQAQTIISSIAKEHGLDGN